jgi:hypothetical protein
MICGNNPKPERPDFCSVCDIAKTTSAEECYRYQLESYLSREGKLPADYDRVRPPWLPGIKYIVNVGRHIDTNL